MPPVLQYQTEGVMVMEFTSLRPKLQNALVLINVCRISHKEAGGSCIVGSLAVRDFLRSLSFEAEAKPVVFSQTMIEASGQVSEVHCGGRALVGPEIVKPTNGPVGWDGHLIVTLPKEGLLIDPTFYQFRRPWCEWIPNIAIVRMINNPSRHQGMPILAGYKNDAKNYHAIWALNQANRKWCDAPAARESFRAPILKSLKREFKKEFAQAA
jgi:hypothetical protein